MLVKLHTISFSGNHTGVKTQDVDSGKLSRQAKQAIKIISRNGLTIKKVAVYDNGSLYYVVTPNLKEEVPKHLPVKLELQSAGLGWVTRVYKQRELYWEFRS